MTSLQQPIARTIRKSPGARVVVANPGAIPELPVMALGLLRAGVLREYLAPFAPMQSRLWFEGLVPTFLRKQVERELGRRRLEHPLASDLPYVPKATLLESIFVASERCQFPQAVRKALLRVRNGSFDRGVADRLQPGDQAVISPYTAALASFRQAKRLNIRSWLEYPTPHHSYAAPILHEEARLVPAYASTLRPYQLPAWLKERVNAEVALADRILVLSTFHKRTFVEAGIDDSKLVVSPLGVDAELFHPAKCERPGSTFRVLFVGQVTQLKGISYLIEGFKQADIKDSELVLVGQIRGGDQPWRGLPRVRHIPHVNRTVLPGIYQSADVFVLPSLLEAFGLTALEAMACGLPVIVSNHSLGPDVIEDGINGFVVPIRDAGAIAERLRSLHASRSYRARIGAAARNRAETLSWERYADAVAESVAGEMRGES